MSINAAALDRWITGNYGEDQFANCDCNEEAAYLDQRDEELAEIAAEFDAEVAAGDRESYTQEEVLDEWHKRPLRRMEKAALTDGRAGWILVPQTQMESEVA